MCSSLKKSVGNIPTELNKDILIALMVI